MKKEIWVFGAGKGRSFSGNPKALFQYIHTEHNNHILPVWLSNDNKLVADLNKRGYLAYHTNSIKGMYYSIFATVFFYEISIFDIGFMAYVFPFKKIYINTWHGTPIKRLDIDVYKSVLKLLLQSMINMYMLLFVNRYVLTATSANVNIYKKIFSLDGGKILITGQPKNDQLLVAGKANISERTIISYMPTWREYDEDFDLFTQYNFDIQKMDKFLSLHNIKLIISLHPFTKIPPSLTNTKCIDINKHNDSYKLLKETDILITDYSSIYLDYLLLDKPIIFTPFDLEQYTQERGFYYDYHSVTPGYKAYNWDEVINAIEDIVKYKKDLHKDERKNVNNKFNKYKDANSSKRVYNVIVKEIKS